jgi:hypothetical protein
LSISLLLFDCHSDIFDILITHVIQTTKKVTLTIRSTTIAEKK